MGRLKMFSIWGDKFELIIMALNKKLQQEGLELPDPLEV